ncbi:MAG: riboflavin biosynthesis protein RibF, partial [Eubacteriales bacterium]|nr:riboflavin biosynthesis protein RibF [Eubacteriales bacterium]
MRVLTLNFDANTGFSLSGSVNPSVIGIGFFDGVHLGHQALIKEVVHAAACRSLPAAILTFDSYPKQDRQGGTRIHIQSLEQRLAVFEAMGIDEVYVQNFNDDYRNLSAEDFFNDCLVEALSAQMIICGEDFCFGRGRSADIHFLKKKCAAAKIDFLTTPLSYRDGEKISSSTIRQWIESGELERVQECLGRPYAIRGRVCHGQSLAHTWSRPTANIEVPDDIVLPPYGVYVTYAIKDERLHRAVSHLGVRPTVTRHTETVAPVLETYFFNFDGDLYGQEVEVRFLEQHRSEIRFDSILAMTAQISRDFDEVEAIHKRREHFEMSYYDSATRAFRMLAD